MLQSDNFINWPHHVPFSYSKNLKNKDNALLTQENSHKKIVTIIHMTLTGIEKQDETNNTKHALGSEK